MKLAVSILPLVVLLALAGCNTPNTRRDMYSPKKGSGYWTTRYDEGQPVADESMKRTPLPPVKQSSGTRAAQ